MMEMAVYTTSISARTKPLPTFIHHYPEASLPAMQIIPISLIKAANGKSLGAVKAPERDSFFGGGGRVKAAF